MGTEVAHLGCAHCPCGCLEKQSGRALGCCPRALRASSAWRQEAALWVAAGELEGRRTRVLQLGSAQVLSGRSSGKLQRNARKGVHSQQRLRRQYKASCSIRVGWIRNISGGQVGEAHAPSNINKVDDGQIRARELLPPVNSVSTDACER